jgi:hypothetical protein
MLVFVNPDQQARSELLMSIFVRVSILIPILFLTACTTLQATKRPADPDGAPSNAITVAHSDAEASAPERVESLPIGVTRFDFINHAQAGMAEQDVFLTSAAGGSVIRPSAEQALEIEWASSPVFRTSAPAEHDPFGLGETPLGPFDRGQPLGFTLGEWMAASGHGSVATSDGNHLLELSFDSLIPAGLYTIWCSEIQMPPDFAITDAPCGEADGSTNTFTADGSGQGAIAIPVAGLPQTTDKVTGVIALAYHSDDATYGPLPGDFGSATHVQLMYMLPAAESVADAAVPASDAPVVLELVFETHVSGGANEQDVYVASEIEGTVQRITAEQANDPAFTELVAFSAGEPVTRTPGDLENVGPFTMGEPLPFTMGEWLAAGGEGKFTADEQGGSLTLSFTNLVPGGLYTLWCAELPKPPNASGIKPKNIACGAPDGSDNVFTADTSGDGQVAITMDVLPQSTADIAGVVALAYHSDDRNHGAKPGNFGSQTHVQLMYKVPAAEQVASGG